MFFIASVLAVVFGLGVTAHGLATRHKEPELPDNASLRTFWKHAKAEADRSRATSEITLPGLGIAAIGVVFAAIFGFMIWR